MILGKGSLTKIRTASKLGLCNVGAVAKYRAELKLGLHPVQRIRATLKGDEFFSGDNSLDLIEANVVLRDAPMFGWHCPNIQGEFPNWHANYLTGAKPLAPLQAWWRFGDFDDAAGDIKGVWELSRFGWLPPLAIKSRLGDERAIPTMNAWIADWCKSNPPYLGRNWKCAQEASIRVMRLAASALILNQLRSQNLALRDFLRAHLLRIASTLSYARAQQNNHATSESAAMFIAGSWLATLGEGGTTDLASRGQKQLEGRVLQLVSPDGSFSQYSVNYHRLFLDTASIVELWRRALGLPPFSDRYIARVREALNWMMAMTDSSTGHAPNIGANDGAHLLSLLGHDFRDYRPCVELAEAMFFDQAPSTEIGRRTASLFGVCPSKGGARKPLESELFDDGGYAVLRNGDAKIIMRYPRFKFRPSHADALHVDLWANGMCLLGGPGSYSYATVKAGEFAGVGAHNTVQFDNHDQMPRVGRFLYGDWVKTHYRSEIVSEFNVSQFEASYRDGWGALHNRHVFLSANSVVVADRVEGFRQHAIARWRLPPGEWTLQGSEVRNRFMRVMITSSTAISICLTEGWASPFYGKKEKIPVIEAKVLEPCRITSVIEWGS
jgi:hypothetical protein